MPGIKLDEAFLRQSSQRAAQRGWVETDRLLELPFGVAFPRRQVIIENAASKLAIGMLWSAELACSSGSTFPAHSGFGLALGRSRLCSGHGGTGLMSGD
jgi:hypothetical protein